MNRSIKTLITGIIFMSIAAVTNAQNIAYTVSFSQPQAHYADVEMEVSGVKKDYIDVKMPVWTPGSYLVREFAKNVEDFKASDNKGRALHAQKLNKNTWRITSSKSDKVIINYSVYSFEISVRTSFVDDSHAFLSPAGLFMYVDGLIKKPATVTIKPFKNWSKISTGLEAVAGKEFTYYAPDFDVLYDSPIEVGNQDIFEFTAAGVKHEVAMYGGGNYDKERLKKDMAKIVEEGTAIFGENPNKRYVFIVHNFNFGGGGLEHLNSTVLGATRNGYTNEATYKGFLGLVAHEYFHLWNVKRLRPIALGPFNYDEEIYTTNLWIAEGFTAYYDDLILRRANLMSPERYVDIVGNNLNILANQPGNRVQSASESSFDAWIKQYRPNENSRNSSISYYDKGAAIAFVMDMEIMHTTQGKKGLDDVMKAMYDEYYKKQNRGFTDAEFKAMVEKVAGKSFDQIYNDYVYGTKPIDHNLYLGYAGLKATDENAQKNEPYLGVTTSEKEGRIMVTHVARGSAAWKDGINVNDEIVAINGQRLLPDGRNTEVERAIANVKIGSNIKVTVVRDGLIREIAATLEKNPTVKYRIAPMEEASASQLAIRKKWLRL